MPSREETLAGRGKGEGRHVLLYDGDCALCRASVERLRRWDRRGRLELLAFQNPTVSSRFPWIPSSALRESVHLVAPGGRTWEGAAAVEKAMSLLPGWARFAALLLRAPLVRPLAARIYRWVARRRTTFGCREHSC